MEGVTIIQKAMKKVWKMCKKTSLLRKEIQLIPVSIQKHQFTTQIVLGNTWNTEKNVLIQPSPLVSSC